MGDFDDDQRHRLRLRFGEVADVYDRARPGYAPEALEWIVGDRQQVLDLAAGTGKLTVALIDRGGSVIAIDPSEPMLAVLRAHRPEVSTRVGQAEATGLPDACVDAVVVGSALHWFDRPAADHEIARVLRPDGVVGVFRNNRDTTVQWVAALQKLIGDRTDMRRVRHSELRRAAPLDPALFEAAETREFPHSQTMTAELLTELYASRSYVIDLDPDARAALLDDIRSFASVHPDLAGREQFELPYRTVATRQRLSTPPPISLSL